MCWKTPCTPQKHPPASTATCMSAPEAGAASRAGTGIGPATSAARGPDGESQNAAPNAISAAAASAERAAADILRARTSVAWLVMFRLRVNRGCRHGRRGRRVDLETSRSQSLERYGNSRRHLDLIAAGPARVSYDPHSTGTPNGA